MQRPHSLRFDLKIDEVWLSQVEPVVDAIARELAHIVFSLYLGGETALADKGKFVAIFKIDMTFPCPSVGVRISFDYADEFLIAVAILDPVSLSLFRRFHVDYCIV